MIFIRIVIGPAWRINLFENSLINHVKYLKKIRKNPQGWHLSISSYVQVKEPA